MESNAALLFLVVRVMILDGDMLCLLSYDSGVNKLQSSLIVRGYGDKLSSSSRFNGS